MPLRVWHARLACASGVHRFATKERAPSCRSLTSGGFAVDGVPPAAPRGLHASCFRSSLSCRHLLAAKLPSWHDVRSCATGAPLATCCTPAHMAAAHVDLGRRRTSSISFHCVQGKADKFRTRAQVALAPAVHAGAAAPPSPSPPVLAPRGHGAIPGGRARGPRPRIALARGLGTHK